MMETTRCSVGGSMRLQGPSDSREWMKRRGRLGEIVGTLRHPGMDEEKVQAL
jgi:hypothetical protein